MHQLQHLLSLTELYLSQQYAMTDWVLTDQETYSFFKTFALRLHSQKVPNVKAKVLKEEDPPKIPQAISEIRENPSTPLPTSYRDSSKDGQDSKSDCSSLPSTREKSGLTVEKNRNESKGEQSAKASASQSVDIRYQDLLIIHPHIPWVEFPPDDSRAKDVSQQWKKEQSCVEALLFSDGHREQHAFLIKIASAIKKYGKGAIVCEISEALPSHQPKIVIASRLLFSKYPELKARYQTSCSLVEIANMTDMMKSPELKRQLWDQITKSLHITT